MSGEWPGWGTTATRAPTPEVRPAEPPAWTRFRHRDAIDGLRALAALLVVLFHAGLPGLDNGFVGVDVFFVLSGFLITSLLARELLSERRVQLVRFYARRVRRLLPVALLVLLVTAAVYVRVVAPLDVFENRWGFPAAALYVSNWLFLSQSQDYFAQGDSPSPVLHYWSLSVEEQFYLVWPLLLVALLSIGVVRRRLGPVLVGLLAGGALLGSAWLAAENQSAAYFSTLARVYQLLLGATLALALLWLARSGRRAPPPLGALAPWFLLAGTAAVVIAATTWGPQNPWWVGVVGCVGTVGILGGLELGGRGPVAAVFTTPVARWLGVWSYAIYLWHWPVIVIGDDLGLLPVQWWVRVPIVTAVTIMLAAATWLLVERPIGSISLHGLRRQRRAVLLGLAGTVATAVATTVILWPTALTQSLVTAAAQQTNDSTSGLTVSGAAAAKRTVLLIGDSHAMFWRPGLAEYAKDENFKLVAVTQVACPWAAVTAVEAVNGQRFHCDQELRQPALAAARKYRPDVTILVSRSVTIRDVETADDKVLAAGSPQWVTAVRSGMEQFVAQLQPLTDEIVLVEPMPETAGDMLECLSTGAPSSSCSERQVDNDRITKVEGVERAIAARDPRVVAVSLDQLICPGGSCPASVQGVPTHRDNQHMTDQYAATLVGRLAALLRARGVPLTSTSLGTGSPPAAAAGAKKEAR